MRLICLILFIQPRSFVTQISCLHWNINFYRMFEVYIDQSFYIVQENYSYNCHQKFVGMKIMAWNVVWFFFYFFFSLYIFQIILFLINGFKQIFIKLNSVSSAFSQTAVIAVKENFRPHLAFINLCHLKQICRKLMKQHYIMVSRNYRFTIFL